MNDNEKDINLDEIPLERNKPAGLTGRKVTRTMSMACSQAKKYEQPGSPFNICGYPVQIFLLLIVELCERFSFYGIRSVLLIYFAQQLYMTDVNASYYYHFYIVICYITPILGGIIADQYWGKYKTILYLSILYALGNGIVAVTSIIESPELNSAETIDLRFMEVDTVPFKMGCTFFGLFVIAVGTGGIKPCVSSFSADQLPPNDDKKRTRFFSLFYFCINLGSVISSYLTPKLRTMECLGHDSCYLYAFGLPSILMFVALLLFVMGSNLYKINKPQGTVFTDFIEATGKKIRRTKSSRNLDDPNVRKTNRLWKMMTFIVPMMFFWAVFDQAGSTLTLQALQLDKSINSTWARVAFVTPSGWFEADQIEAANPPLLLAMIPIFACIVFPALNKFVKMTPLRKMGLGLILTAMTSKYSEWLQLRIDDSYTYIGPNSASDSVIRNASFIYQVHAEHYADIENKFEYYNFHPFDPWEGAPKPIVSAKSSKRFWSFEEYKKEGIVDGKLFDNIIADSSIYAESKKPKISFSKFQMNNITMVPGELNKLITFGDRLYHVNVDQKRNGDTLAGKSRIDIYSENPGKLAATTISCENEHFSTTVACKPPAEIAIPFLETSSTGRSLSLKSCLVSQYSTCSLQLTSNSTTDSQFKLTRNIGTEGVYSLVDFTPDDDSWTIHTKLETDINGIESYGINYQMMTYFIISVAEICVSITGLEYTYAQAPKSMKAVASALWLLPVCLGNFFFMFLQKLNFSIQTHRFKLFNTFFWILIIMTFGFIFIALKYNPATEDEDDDKEEENQDSLRKAKSGSVHPVEFDEVSSSNDKINLTILSGSLINSPLHHSTHVDIPIPPSPNPPPPMSTKISLQGNKNKAFIE